MNATRLVAAIAAATLTLALGGAASAASVDVLHSFGGADGVSPTGQLVDGGDGYLYGATFYGGLVDPTNSPDGYGSLFRVNAAGSFATIHRFDWANGARPNGLIRGPDGLFYGTTSHGGDAGALSGGQGTLFRVNAAGALTVLHRFMPAEGSWPSAPPTFGPDGALYGTSRSDTVFPYYGTLWRWTAQSGLTVFHQFMGLDGNEPLGPLTLARDGNLYGTTNAGGAFRSCGTVFRIVPPGVHQLLHSFSSVDGCEPKGGVVQGPDRAFYGTTETGMGWGSVFRMDGAGGVTTLHFFDAYLSTGGFPAAGLFLASDGFLYGTAARGGQPSDPFQRGVIFRVSPAGGLAVVHTFTTVDGSTPMSAVMQGTDGALYGATTIGGAFGRGVVYRFVPPGVPGTVPALTSLSLSQTTVTAGSAITGTVRLSSAAPAGGAAVALKSSARRKASVPSTVMVPAGATSATFAIVTKRGRTGAATISASYRGVTRSAGLTVVR